MSEFSIEGLARDPKTSVVYKSSGNVINVVESRVEQTLVDGTYISVTIYASRSNAIPSVGNLTDVDSEYTITVDKAP